MAMFPKRSIITSLVLSTLFGCDVKVTPSQTKISEAVGQAMCGVNSYDQKSDSCKTLRLYGRAKYSDKTSTASSSRDLVVIDTTIAKKWQGCIKMTQGTKLPLSYKECKDLFLENGRDGSVFISPHGAMKYYDPIVLLNEEWYLVHDTFKKVMYWKIPKG